MTEWSTDVPQGNPHWKKLSVGETMKMSTARIRTIMSKCPGEFAWMQPDLLKRIAAPSVSEKKVLSTIYRSPEGISQGVLINRFKDYPPEAVKGVVDKLEADGLIRSVRSVHNRNLTTYVTYHAA